MESGSALHMKPQAGWAPLSMALITACNWLAALRAAVFGRPWAVLCTGIHLIALPVLILELDTLAFGRNLVHVCFGVKGHPNRIDRLCEHCIPCADCGSLSPHASLLD